jgi:hypothetical protein
MTHAVVSLPVLDVRAAPRHAAELGSQLLMGETVALLGSLPRAGWVRVRNDADGYRGWVRTWGLVPATAERARRWRQLARGVIAVPAAAVRAGRGSGLAVSPVYFGSRLIASRPLRGWAEVELPDGRHGHIEADALAGRQAPSLEERVSSLLGVQYLWGGRSPAGYDCSGFVQQVLREQGVALPRDARHQWRASRRLGARAAGRSGDLAFFRRPGEAPSHVGIALGAGYFAHCRARVLIASVDADNPLCDNDLLPQFMGWFRPSRG